VHFGQRHSPLLPFYGYIFAPGKSPVEVQPEILDILSRKVYVEECRLMECYAIWFL
jgi:hypothetical protein